MKIVTTLTLLMSILWACSSDTDCSGFPQGSIQRIQTIVYLGEPAYLYLRVSGFQDKQFFYELYDHKPVFDHCNITVSKPILEDHIFEQDNYVSHIEINKNKMAIIYTNAKPANYDFESIDIKVLE